MSNEIMKVTATEAIAIGKQFFDSGMFADIKSAGQAVVKIMAGAEIGIPPFAAMSGIHIIQGKPTIGAGLIASAVKGSGKYDYKVVEQTDKKCSIDFYQGKEKIGNSTFTAEDAKKAGTKNMDKFPVNMLFARCISNGVKWYCPDVFAGPVYTPEELGNITEDNTSEVVSTEPIKDEDFYNTWETAINIQQNEGQLRDLWEQNKATCGADIKIKQMFKDAKSKLNDNKNLQSKEG